MSVENSNKPSIPDFFKGKSVFITGGLGSLGKVTVEKLLRSCPGIENIFLLARPKKNNNVQDRLNELKNSPSFANLKENSPELLKKIVMIEGDTAKDNLGISEADQKIICEKVSIFINSAASINFNDPLKDAVNTNVRSIMELLKLARKVKKLESIVHVSTCYTNWFYSDNDTVLVEEKFYPAEYKPNDILKLTETVSEKLLEKVTPHILGKHANTYTFTKKLAEEFIKNEKENLPITIVRPSMIIGSAKEPMPGWIDSWVGPTTYAYFIARGIFRSFYVHKNNVTEVIPVDMTANLIIASAWKVGTEKIQKEPEIYHSTIGIANLITWKNLMDLYLANAKKYPLDDVIWYPTYRMIKTEFGSKFYGFFTERIPAYLIDFASIIMGKKPRMIRLYDKIEYGYSFTRFCTINPIRFECKNFEKLIDKMSPNDVKEFDFDVRKINWNKFIEEQHLGARKYLWGSKSTDFAAGRRKIARLRIANYLLVGSTIGSSLFLSYKGFNLLTHKEPKIEINLDQTN